MGNHNKIAKNTLYLFVRMMVQMTISLYTSRLILEVLGVNDYGVYGVVGGFVALVAYVNQALSSSTMRFITYSLGENSYEHTKKVFNTAFFIHVGLSVLFIILAETLGLYFFYTKLNIPQETMDSAFIIYQLSIVSTVFVIMTLPYSSIIIAYEKMSIFAYFSIVDTILKLIIVYLIIIIPFNKLVFYGWLMLLTQIIYSVIYYWYCHKNIVETHLKFSLHKESFKGMLSFAGWSMFGCTAAIGYTQGLNVLLNIFGGVAINASRGLAVQVQGIVTTFVSNFQTAVNPQIIKSFAQKRYEELHRLIYLSSKFSYLIVFLIITPLVLNIHIVLKSWLGIIPEMLPTFLILILLITLVDTLSNPIMKSADATGKIRNYHIIVGSFLMLILPTAYIFLKANAPLYVVFIIQLCFSLIALFVRLLVIRRLIHLKIKIYIIKVILPILRVTVPSIMLLLVLRNLPIQIEWLFFLISCSVITIVNLLLIWFLGLEVSERIFIYNKIRNIINR